MKMTRCNSNRIEPRRVGQGLTPMQIQQMFLVGTKFYKKGACISFPVHRGIPWEQQEIEWKQLEGGALYCLHGGQMLLMMLGANKKTPRKIDPIVYPWVLPRYENSQV